MKNPFYVLVLIAGVLFAVTACAYGVMIVQKLEPAEVGAETHGLIEWMDQHGFTALMIELGVLAVATVAAIGTDEFWSRRKKEKETTTAPNNDRSPE